MPTKFTTTDNRYQPVNFQEVRYTPIDVAPITTESSSIMFNPYDSLQSNLQIEKDPSYNFTPYSTKEPVTTTTRYDTSTSAYPTSDALSFLQSKEGKNNRYDTKNLAGSSAYGKYQFMPNTAKSYSKRIGINPDEWQLPANQEAIMQEAFKDYARVLGKVNTPVTDSNLYAVHQLGEPRAKRLFTDKLTQKDINVMRSNLPPELKNTNDVIGAWKAKYLQ